MSLMTAITARLGSRFCIIWDPVRREIKHSGIGAPYARPCRLEIGVEVAGHKAMFPFAGETSAFDSVEQTSTPTRLTWRGFLADTGTLVRLSACAPFYPKNRETSLLPAFFFDLTIEARKDLLRQHGDRHAYQPAPRHAQGRIFFRLDRAGTSWQVPKDRQRRFNYREDLYSPDPYWNNPGEVSGPRWAECTDSWLVSDLPGLVWTETGFSVPFNLDTGHNALTLTWCSHTTSGLLDSTDGPSQLAYVRQWPDLDSVVATICTRRSELLANADRFDRLLAGSSLGPEFVRFFAHAMQWHFANTWWLRNRAGEEWFTVTEGKCLFLSTVDVEYNVAPFYLAFWPELLRLQLERWTGYISLEGYLAHDIGRLPVSRQAVYPHPMECEENANWLLMLAGYSACTQDLSLLSRMQPAVNRLADYLLAADVTGRGMPGRGTANTIDDASDAVQFARENIYLAIKVYAAVRAVRHFAEHWGDAALASECIDYEKRCCQTLENEAWRGDHYATCLTRPKTDQSIMRDSEAALVGAGHTARASHSKQAVDLAGADAATPHNVNGLFYLYLAGLDHGLNVERLKVDLQTAHAATLHDYGNFHSSADHSNIWISQNLWRDAIAGYLGLDFLPNVERYMEFQRFANMGGLSRGFVDTYGWNNLHSYPRGLAVAALLFGATGTQRQGAGWARRPVRLPCRFPLVPAEDWPTDQSPWFERSIGNCSIAVLPS